MKKWLSVILSITIIALSSVVLSPDSINTSVDKITKEEAYQFADELKEMNAEEYDVSNRLIVSADKKIDYLDAIDVATGIDDLYVLQFDDEASVKNAEEYYNSLDYVNYVEYDTEVEDALCSTTSEKTFDFTPNCPSTVNQNIDDAIKLLKKESIAMPKIRIGVIDSGIARTKITESRLDGGYSYLENHTSDGTQDNQGHGTEVAGTIILNTLDYIKLNSYQIFDNDNQPSIMTAVSAIYLAVADDCRIINCSFIYKTAIQSDKESMINAVNYATSKGIIIVCGAGNDSESLKNNNTYYPQTVKNTITVGAVTQTNKLAAFSNFGDGVDIYATGYGLTSYDTSGNKLYSFSGTSAATPVISSICALLVTVKPDITVDKIKQLLVETGYSFSEENQSDKDRIIADAYECVKKLLGKELEQVQLNYSVVKNETTNCSDISFSNKDKDVKIYYTLGLGSLPEIPYKEMTGASQYEYKLGDTVKLSKWQMITVAAYAPGKAKKVLYFSAPEYSNESGYRLTQSSSTQQYNKIDRCQIIDQKVIEVPETIDGIEIQQIGDWCFIGNKTVEKIILPKTVKQISRYAFSNCPNLKEVIAPGVEICGMYAFYQCDNLVNVEMPNLTCANTGMFKNCTSLETAKLGTLTEIDNHAFYGCENLRLVKTTDADISFAVNTFKDCNTLTIYTPDKKTSMYKFGKENGIPVIISFNYKFSGWSREGFIYEDTELSDKVTYPAEKIYKMWSEECINQPPDYDELGFLLNTVDDNVINSKDFSFINKYRNT